MVNIRKLIKKQNNLGFRITKAYKTLLKKGPDNINLNIIEASLTTLNDYLKHFRENDKKINSLDIKAFKDDPYFVENYPKQIEEAYCDVVGEILEKKNELMTAESNNVNTNSIHQH